MPLWVSSTASRSVAFFFSVITATPCVFLVVLGRSCAVEKIAARPSVEYTTICSSASSATAFISGLLSLYAPVSFFRLVFVS